MAIFEHQEARRRLENLRTELEAVVREDTTRALPQGNAPVDNYVDRTLSCNLRGNDSEHVRAATKTVVEKNKLVLRRVATSCGRTQSTLAVTPDSGGRGVKMTCEQIFHRGVFRAWHYRQWRRHQRVKMLIGIHH